ncbi:MAG TPA: DoxX family protein [Polyangiaceae bacterium]
MSSIQNKLPTVARYSLGLAFFVFGLNGFLHFLPQPPISGPPLNFIGALIASGYMFPLLKGTEVLMATLLLANRFVPLALTILAPVMVNIIAFHLFLEPAALALPLVLLALELYLAYSYRDAFAPLLRAVNSPHVSSPDSHRSRVPAAAS